MCGGMVAFWATLATRLSLLVGDGTMLLCGLGSRGRRDREPVAIFTGEVLPFYAAIEIAPSTSSGRPRQRGSGLGDQPAHDFGHGQNFPDTSGGLTRCQQRFVTPARLRHRPHFGP
jgi:hypothetical protein